MNFRSPFASVTWMRLPALADDKLKIWYPDFSLQYGLLIEYFGSTGNAEYLERSRHKLNVYRANLFDVIPLYPSDVAPAWQNHLIDQIEDMLGNRVRSIR